MSDKVKETAISSGMENICCEPTLGKNGRPGGKMHNLMMGFMMTDILRKSQTEESLSKQQCENRVQERGVCAWEPCPPLRSQRQLRISPYG